MPTFNDINGTSSTVNSKKGGYTYEKVDLTNKKSKALFLVKVFLTMFIALLITAGVATLVGFLFTSWLVNDTELASKVLIFTMIITAIALIVLSFTMPKSLSKGKHGILIPGLFYVVLMGVLLSSFVIFIDWRVLLFTIGVTSVIFGLMALMGLIFKGNLSSIALLILGLMIGAGVLYILSIFLSPFLGADSDMYLIASLVFFALIMFVTMFDVARIKSLAESGEQSNNLVLYSAFIIYTDFISISVRLIYLILRIAARRK